MLMPVIPTAIMTLTPTIPPHDDLSIINNAKEEIHKLSVYLHLNWNPGKANRFFTNFGVQHDWNIINHYGNSPSKQKYDVGIYFLGQNYQHVLTINGMSEPVGRGYGRQTESQE